MQKQVRTILQRVAWHFACICMAVFTLVPFLWAASSSFKPLSRVFADLVPFSFKTFIPMPPTLEAYVALFTETGYPRGLLNTAYVAVTVVVFGVLLNSMAGFAFAKLDFPGKRLLFTLTIVSFMIPFEAISIPLYSIINRFGWLNSFKAVIVPGIANGLTIFLFRQFFAGIPTELIEAATIDGASKLRIYSTIFLPLSKPAIVSASLLLFVGQWEAFLWPLLVANAPETRLIQVALSYINTQYATYWNQIFAGAVIAGIIPLIIILPLQRYYVKGISSTGIKG
ncbi:MAG TPA: carbohydrate ABC transporter permease [Firmicutes bacterium]|nr:carbohydrate ABC transporter permease [Bacillota bacterium]